MEVTKQIKEKIFGTYIGRTVVCGDASHLDGYTKIITSENIHQLIYYTDYCNVVLTRLSEITIDDAIECGGLIGWSLCCCIYKWRVRYSWRDKGFLQKQAT